MELKSLKGLGVMIDQLLLRDIIYTEEELKEYTELVYKAAIAKPNPREVTKEAVYEMYLKSLLQ